MRGSGFRGFGGHLGSRIFAVYRLDNAQADSNPKPRREGGLRAFRLNSQSYLAALGAFERLVQGGSLCHGSFEGLAKAEVFTPKCESRLN